MRFHETEAAVADPGSDSTARSSGQVRSLTRALRLLRYLAESGEGLSLTDLSEVASLPPSTTHRLLTTLEAEHFVRPDPQGGVWRVGVMAFYVGSAFARNRDRLTLTRPYLRRLMELTGETANLFVESDGEGICIGQIESRHAMRAITGVGGRVQLHASGAGKALLAWMDPARRERLVAGLDLRPETEHTITDRDRLSALYRDCTLFALTPRVVKGEFEGGPVVYLEAAAFGKAAVATDAGGAPSAVLDGETGIVAEEDDVAGVADALRRLLYDESLRDRLGRRARDRVEAMSWESYAERLTVEWDRLGTGSDRGDAERPRSR